MGPWLKRLTLFQKTLCIIVVAVVILSLFSSVFMYRTTKQTVTRQIQEGVSNALSMAALQVHNLTFRGISALVSLCTDSDIKKGLMEPKPSSYERFVVSQQIVDTISGAYYAIDSELSIAIVSLFNDTYANWSMYSSDILIHLKDQYLAYRSSPEYKPSVLYTDVAKSIKVGLSDRPKDVYVMIIPIEDFYSNTLYGVGIALFDVEKLNSLISFSDNDEHTTFIIDDVDRIVAAKDGVMVGRAFSEVLQELESRNRMVLTQENVFRSRLELVDVMNGDYIDRQTWAIMRSAILWISMMVMVLVCIIFIILRSVTKPLKLLSQRMVRQDAGAIERGYPDIGRNEVVLLERSFDIMQENITELAKENEIKEKEKRLSEIKALQAQIRPHFLFNALNSIRCTIMNKHSEKAAEMVLKLSLFLRKTLYKGDEFVSLAEELETVGYYLDITRLRHDADFLFECSILDDVEGFMLPRLLLQPLVENSYIHGIESMDGGGVIKVEAYIQDHFLFIRVMDNGGNLQEPLGADLFDRPQDVVSKKDGGIGLDNVYRRLHLYFSGKSDLRVYRDGSGWTVSEIRIELVAEV